MSVHIAVTRIDEHPSPPGGAGPMWLLARRRAWRDRWIVLAAMCVVALATFLAYAGPQLILGTLDDGAADAARAQAGGDAITVTFPLGNPSGNNVDSVRGSRISDFAQTSETIVANLPRDTASVVVSHTLGAVSAPYTLMSVTSAAEREAAASDNREPEPQTRTDADVVIAFVPSASMTVVDGESPVLVKPDPPLPGSNAPPTDLPPLQVALTHETLEALNLQVGDHVTLGRANGSRVDLEVTAQATVDDPQGDAVVAAPGLFEPQSRVGGTGVERPIGTVLMPADIAEEFTTRLGTPLTASIVMSVDPTLLTLDLAHSIPPELERLETQSETLLPDGDVRPRVSSGLGDALSDYPVRARAALAQMSVLIAGVTAAAAAVIALMAHLLIRGRARDIQLERARGAAVGSTMGALLIESAMFTLAGLALGYGAASIVTPGATPVDPLALLVALVAVGATPLLGAATARASWAGKREPANRRDRAKIERARAARAVTRDGLVLVVAAMAVWSLRGRGVLQTQTVGVDPFLAVAPALVALAVALIVVRLAAIPRRVVQALSRLSRGAAGLLTAARSREPIAALPLVALALALAVGAYGALLSSTVDKGQDAASWERIGGDARIAGAVDAGLADQWREQGLVVTQLIAAPRTTIAMGSSLSAATVIAIDESYVETLRAVDGDATAELDAFTTAVDAWVPGEPIPALASAELREIDVYQRSDVFLGRTFIPVTFIDEAQPEPDGWLDGPYIFVALEPLLTVDTQEPIEPDVTVVVGPGTDAAIADAAIPAGDVWLRSDWLETARSSALMGGVQRTMTWAVLAVAALAAVGLLVSVATGARERGRAIALLRTQGVPPRLGWWLAFTDLVPMVLASAVAAVGAALVVMVVLSPALGLVVLSGGVNDPPPSIDPALLAPGGIALAGLLLIAVIAEVVVQRRARLSEVLRYGETR